jgi:alkylated DNA repair dioxygenase AlkB
MKRGKHIDNKVNGGHIIVGCTIGDSERFMEVSGTYGKNNKPISYRFALPPRTLYVMKGHARYNFFHDPINVPNTDNTDTEPPYAMVFRFGKFDIDRGLL